MSEGGWGFNPTADTVSLGVTQASESVVTKISVVKFERKKHLSEHPTAKQQWLHTLFPPSWDEDVVADKSTRI